MRTLARIEPDSDWPAWCREIAGAPAKLLTRGNAGYLIDKLQAELASPVRSDREEGDAA